MIREGLFVSLRAFVLFTLLTGLAYPFLVLLIGQLGFRAQAQGSLITAKGAVLGSEWIGQNFEQEQYFWPRPSATSPKAYNGEASSGSNFGPLHPDLKKAFAERKAALQAANPDSSGPVPLDLLTASGSGLDPHISPEAARYQVARVARARHLSVDEVQQVVDRFTQGRQLGFLGEERVNVLKLNLALDGVL